MLWNFDAKIFVAWEVPKELAVVAELAVLVELVVVAETVHENR